jgi:hypothetical protein
VHLTVLWMAISLRVLKERWKRSYEE